MADRRHPLVIAAPRSVEQMPKPIPSAATYDVIPGYGALYDAVPAYAQRGDVAFYGEEASRAEGRILEIGCGTGRVLLPIARSGKHITGLDGSLEMLEQCRVRVAEEPAAIRDRVRLVHGDASSFSLGERFPLVIAPFRILQMLTTVDEQLGCVRSVARHLAPGGRFVFDVFNPNFAVMVGDRTAETEDTPLTTLPDGRTFRRTVRVLSVRFTEQVSDLEIIYYVDGKRYVHPFGMRFYLCAELEHLLERAGMRVVAVYGDFDRSALTDSSPEIVVVAELADPT